MNLQSFGYMPLCVIITQWISLVTIWSSTYALAWNPCTNDQATDFKMSPKFARKKRSITEENKQFLERLRGNVYGTRNRTADALVKIATFLNNEGHVNNLKQQPEIDYLTWNNFEAEDPFEERLKKLYQSLSKAYKLSDHVQEHLRSREMDDRTEIMKSQVNTLINMLTEIMQGQNKNRGLLLLLCDIYRQQQFSDNFEIPTIEYEDMLNPGDSLATVHNKSFHVLNNIDRILNEIHQDFSTSHMEFE